MAPIVSDQLYYSSSHISKVPRQNDIQPITQTIVRESTTLTTTFTLGPTSTSDSSPAVITLVTTTSSPPLTSQSSGPSSGVVAGAVLGSVLGFLVLCVLWYKCCVNGRSVVWLPRYDSDREEARFTRGDGGGGGQWKSGSRGGGGREWEKQHGIRRPDRATMRRERKRRHARVSRKERIEAEKWNGGHRRSGHSGRYKRRSGVVMKEKGGMLGWGLAKSQPKRYEIRRESVTSDWGNPARGWRGPEKEKGNNEHKVNEGLKFDLGD